MAKRDEVPSPCINVCSVDEDVGLCRGCFRNLHEIAQWPSYTNEEKTSVLNSLSERKQKFGDALKPY